jgi:hypothetical protein
MHVGVWYLARGAALDPRATLLPQRVPNTAVADLKGGTELSDFGYVVALPWKVSKRNDVKMLSTFKLENGTDIFLYDVRDPAPGIASTEKSSPIDAAAFQSVYGSLTDGSRYEWMCAKMNASPTDVSFWHSRARNAKTLTLIDSKTGMLGKAKVIYSISAGGMHGFQLGDPQQPDSPVFLRLFDANDRELWMILHRAPNGIGFTQEQINAMVASIHPATTEVANP